MDFSVSRILHNSAVLAEQTYLLTERIALYSIAASCHCLPKYSVTAQWSFDCTALRSKAIESRLSKICWHYYYFKINAIWLIFEIMLWIWCPIKKINKSKFRYSVLLTFRMNCVRSSCVCVNKSITGFSDWESDNNK